jgi:hypothetical protein
MTIRSIIVKCFPISFLGILLIAGVIGCAQTLEFTVVDAQNNSPLRGVAVSRYDTGMSLFAKEWNLKRKQLRPTDGSGLLHARGVPGENDFEFTLLGFYRSYATLLPEKRIEVFAPVIPGKSPVITPSYPCGTDKIITFKITPSYECDTDKIIVIKMYRDTATTAP